jgi:NADH-quinone oxidoreductase subunit A
VAAAFRAGVPAVGGPDGFFWDDACEKLHKLMQGWLPILLMLLLGAAFGAGSVLLSRLVGPQKPTPEKLAPYECGMPPVGDARERHSVKFYLEVAFLYPWAMALRDLRWAGYVQVVLFFGILLSGYVYVWRQGVLDWGREKREISR